MSLNLREGSSTPWGRAQGKPLVLAPGVYNVTTAGHGGIKLDRARNAMVPEACRRPGGWYEEDCEAYIPMAAFLEEVRLVWSHVTHDTVVAGLARWERKALAALVAAGKVRMTEEATKIVAEEEAEAARLAKALASGLPIRKSALANTHDGRVHVLFLRADGTYEGRYMSHATYDAIPLLETATPADFERHGKLEPAPSDFVREASPFKEPS